MREELTRFLGEVQYLSRLVIKANAIGVIVCMGFIGTRMTIAPNEGFGIEVLIVLYIYSGCMISAVWAYMLNAMGRLFMDQEHPTRGPVFQKSVRFFAGAFDFVAIAGFLYATFRAFAYLRTLA